MIKSIEIYRIHDHINPHAPGAGLAGWIESGRDAVAKGQITEAQYARDALKALGVNTPYFRLRRMSVSAAYGDSLEGELKPNVPSFLEPQTRTVEDPIISEQDAQG
jgi:hypothetical protein